MVGNGGEHKISWDDNYNLLQEFVKENGRLPKHYDKINNIVIGKWCHRQIVKYSKEQMNDEQKHKLEAISGWK